MKSIKHNYTFYPKHLLWLLLVSFILIGKTSYAQEKKLLWEISNDDSVVYLVGTVHALEWHDYPLDILYEEAYRVADRVVFEVDLSSFGPEDAENFIQQNGFYPQGQTIRSHVSNKTYNLLREAAQAQGLDFNEVVKIKPWVWAFSFIDAMIQQSDLDPELGIDQLFSDKAAQDNKEIMELETWIDQLKIFSDAPLDKQGKYLDEIVNDLESNSIGDEEAAVDAWRDSDLSQLDTLVEEIRERDDYAYGRLIKDRNNKWVPKIINYLNMPGTTTVFAGAAHFAGKDSVVKLLDRINYKATRLPSPPRLLHSPTNQTLNEGSSVTLSSQFRSLSTISYIWFHNGRTLEGENDPTLEINSISEKNAGSYILKATNEAGSTTTTAVELRVIQKPKPPEIIQQPQDLIIGLGKEATFSINGQGTEPLNYQWYKDGKQIAGATDATCRIASVSQGDLGIYSVRVQNKAGKAYSQTVKLSLAVLHTLTVASRDSDSGVTVTLSPLDWNGQAGGTTQFTRVYSKGTEVTLTAVQSVGANQFKEWLKNGEPAGTEPTVTVMMDYDRTLRAVYEVGIQSPLITTHPISHTVDAGASVTFSVAATGTQPLSYRWRRNGGFLGSATESPTLTLGNVQPEQGGTYRVVVSNGAGEAMSEAAELVVKETLHTLTVASRDPDSGITVTVSPADENGHSDGTTQFTRVYAKGTEVMLSAMQTVGVNQFKQWLKNGVSIGTEPTVTVTMDYDRTLRAVYEPKPVTLTVASRDPDSGVTVTVSPTDNNGQAGGTTQFTRVYSKGTEVTLTTDSTSGSNQFKQWLANGVPAGTNPTVTVIMDYDRTLRAVYEPKPVTLTVVSRDPDSGVTVTVSPADRNGQAGGTTQLTRFYAKGTEVTLTAVQSVGDSQFKQWLANGVPVSTERTVTVTMDYDRTLRAVFYKHGPIELMNPNTTISPFTFTFIAKESSTYEVQVTQDLKNWSKLGELKGKSGEVEFTDPRLPKVPFKRNYFRVKLVE